MANLTNLTTNGQAVVKIFASVFKAGISNDLISQGAALLDGGMTKAQLYSGLLTNSNIQAAFPLYTAVATSSAFVGALVDNVFANSGVATAYLDAVKTNWTTRLDTEYAGARGTFMDALLSALMSDANATSTDANIVAVYNTINNRAEVGATLALSGASPTFTTMSALQTQTSTVTNDSATITTAVAATVTGSTFTLTTSADSKTGTSGNDVFDGSQNVNGTNTFSALDTLDGGAGNDVLSLVVNGAAAIAPASMKAIETVNVTSTADGSGVNFAGATGVTEINLTGSTGAAVASGIASATTSLGVKSTASAATFTFTDAALAGSTDTVSVKIENVSAGALIIQPTGGATTNGAETIALTSGGSGANTLASLADGAATSLAKVTVAGDQGLTITANLATTVTTFDANTNTGGVDVDFDAGALTVTGGSGNDVFSFETTAGAVSVVGGAGNDSFAFSGAGQTFTSADTVDGGDGTNDKVIALSADAAGVASSLTKLTNVEHVEISNAAGAAINFTYFGSGVNQITYAGGVGHAGNQTLNTGATTINLKAAANTTAMTLTADGSGTTDAVTIKFADTTASFAVNENITGTGVETMTIDVTKAADDIGTGNITLTGSGSAATTLNITGGFSLSTTGGGKLEAKTIDASGMTVGATSNGLVMTAAATTNTSQTITGSGGLDTLFGGSGNDSINGGAGNDAITSGAGTDTILGGTGNDTLTLGDNFTTGDSIDGGDNTDTLSISATSVAALNALSLSAVLTLNDRVSNVEKLSFSNDFGASFDLSRADAISDVTLAAASNAGYVISSFGATNKLTFTTDTNNVDATLGDASGSSDVFNVVLSKAGDLAAGTLTVGTTAATGQVETVTVNATEATASSTVRAHSLNLDSAAGLKTLTITGTEGFTSTVSSETLATINAADLTEGAAAITATASLVAITATGSAQGDTFSTGGGADSVSGGLGDDNLTGGSGNDTLDGGAGNDTVVAGVGVDSLVGGDGTDTLSATGWTIDTTTDGGSTAVAGLVINGGTTSVSAATIIGYIGYNNGGGADETISSDTTAVAAGTVQAVGAAATIGSRVDTFTGFENFTGSAGEDYIVGTSGANTITGGLEADVLTGGSAADTFVQANTASVAFSAKSRADGANWANADTITFGAGVDVITDFVSGTDKFDTAGTAGIPTTLIGLASDVALTGNTVYGVRGDFVAATGVFTLAAAGADFVVLNGTGAALAANAGAVILVGATSMVAADFV